ncbi:uncharacterized protein LOC122714375 isoform X1 [Apis laboriosa]|uniref:uncharacterized protein LOC122714375 isoform X1 n=1 Tax=Apis laboriosa TaxID=183418 RepID=UPI001CC7DFDC|nr:uncharacterized protein LOC122714375 isoform X1 [Apis laboriosa]
MTSEVNATKVGSSGGAMSLVSTISSSPGGSVSAAIATAATAIPTNPSTTVTGGAAVTSTAKPDHHVYNATGYLVEHDELDHSILAGFSDIQTVFLACISTLLPLIVALGIAFGVRHVWRKYRNRRDSSSGLPWYRSVYSRDNTAESLHHRPHSGGTTIQSATRILSAQDLVNGLDRPRYVCETEVMEEVNVATATPVEYTPPGNTNKNANGNIITLTLKNNHLIVETEERAVTMEDNKNRRYQDNGCSFVVEVQPSYQNGETEANKGSTVDDVAADQQALVHREEIGEDRTSGFENTRLFGSTNTGLSQSDLSISSQGSVNPSYRYGNQMEYDSGHLGYPMYGGSYESDTLSRKLEGGSKWVEFDKSPDTEKTLPSKTTRSNVEATKDGEESSPSMTGKQNNLDVSQGSGGSMDQQDSTDASISTDTVRSNPNLQVNGATPSKTQQQRAASNEVAGRAEANKPVITGALLKDDIQEDTFQEQQRKLGNGTLTPEHKDGERMGKNQKAETGIFVPSHKRSGSIPPRLIEESLELELEPKKSLDIYSQIKTSTKSILPGLSPKFELLQNEVSPIEEKES